MNFVLPPKNRVGALDPEIAGEGVKVIMSDGEIVNFNPPPPRPVMPDWSTIKSIRHYFNRTDPLRPYPAWLYHPTEAPRGRIFKDAAAAKEVGVVYRRATDAERNRYGISTVWDYEDGCEWRAQPDPEWVKFDPSQPGHGKTYIAAAPNPLVAQNALIEALIPTVTAAVVQALKSGAGPAQPANISDADWSDFLQFQAFKKTQSTISEAASGLALEGGGALNRLSPEEEYELWEAEAAKKGVRVDKRWSLERLKSEVEKAA